MPWYAPQKLIETVQDDSPEYVLKHKRIVLEHHALKGLQLGGAAALVLLPPYYYFYRRYHFFHLVSRLNTTAGLAAMAGMGLSTVAGAVRLQRYTDAEVYDHAYRLNHNDFQNFFDVSSASGSFCVGITTLASGFPFLNKPHFGVDVIKEPWTRSVLRATLGGCHGWGMGFLVALMVLPAIRGSFAEARKRQETALNEAELRGLVFVEDLALDGANAEQTDAAS